MEMFRPARWKTVKIHQNEHTPGSRMQNMKVRGKSVSGFTSQQGFLLLESTESTVSNANYEKTQLSSVFVCDCK